MMQTTYRTARGTEIVLAIRTERPNLADHNVTNPAWDLVASVGNAYPVPASLTEHPEHGLCVRNDSLGSEPFLAPVPADARDAVRAVVATYRQERDRRHAAQRQADRSYEERRATMRRVLGSACVDE